jgi:ppGpp synthetase/RelA/SpoT-type nucleotidyltranferase
MIASLVAAREFSQRTIEDDDSWLDAMAWVTLDCPREAINKAGRDLVALIESSGEVDKWTGDDWAQYNECTKYINHWRACHAYQLNAFQINLRRMGRKFDRNVLIAQRTKRLISIFNKLWDRRSMKLTQMQDVGGCRAVLRNVKAVQELDNFIRKESRMKHEFSTHDDYISHPKPSGYRGIHLVYRFHADKPPASGCNGLKIEIQLRSQFQHAWATTVETVGTFLGAALKSSVGPDDWLRFFALIGSGVAFREKQTALVPDTPTNQSDLVRELREYAKTLNVEQRLVGYANAIQTVETRVKDAHYFLLELDPRKTELAVTGFGRDRGEDAQKAYVQAERKVRSNPGTDAVLVSVDSITSLSRAYPNYYADTTVFLNLLRETLA